ncbi:MAG: hypothetical protein ACE5JT_02025 [Nitrosopumilaceae archaeon]
MPRILGIKPSKDIKFNLKRIRSLSSKIEKKLNGSSEKDEKILDELSVGELKDLDSVLMVADHLLCKYEDKKEIRTVLKEFLDILTYAANSVDSLNEELADLVISAEIALNQIKSVHDDVTQNLAFEEDSGIDYAEPKSDMKAESSSLAEKGSPINLTNTSTGLNTRAYLTKTPLET